MKLREHALLPQHVATDDHLADDAYREHALLPQHVAMEDHLADDA
jgi:hypothetical protein